MLLALQHILRGCRYEKNEGIVGSNSQASIIHAWTMWLKAQCPCLPMEIRVRSLTKSSSEGGMEDGKIIPLDWNSTIIPKTKLSLVSCSLCSLSVGSCLLAAIVSQFPTKVTVLSSQDTLCSLC